MSSEMSNEMSNEIVANFSIQESEPMVASFTIQENEPKNATFKINAVLKDVSEIEQSIEALENEVDENYDELSSSIEQIQDELENKATLSQLQQTSNILQNSIDTLASSKQDKGDYATNTKLNSDIYNVSQQISQLSSTKADVSNTYTKQQVDSNIQSSSIYLSNKIDENKEEIKKKAYSSELEKTNIKISNVEKSIPINISELYNDVGYLTEHQDISNLATKNEIPTNTSQLVNDSSFVTEDELSLKVDETTYNAGILELKNEVDNKQNILIAGENITIENNVISSIGGGIDKTKLSEFTDDLGNSPIHTHSQYLTEHQSLSNYALKTEIPTVPTNVSSFTNDSQYQTYQEVVGLIAQIPQFEIVIVEELPVTGERMKLYMLPKESASGDDIYDEYIWITATSRFELVGTTTVDLSQYAKKSEIPTKTSELTNDSEFITDTDYATTSKAGVIKSANGVNVNSTTGTISVATYTSEQYENLGNYVFIGKGTLENVLTAKGYLTLDTLPIYNGEVQ